MPNGFFGQNLQNKKKTKTKKEHQKQKQKKEHHHQILHIPNSLGAKFKLKLTILIFGQN